MQEWRCLVLLPDGKRDQRRIFAHDAASAAAQLLDEDMVALEVRSGQLSLAECLNQPVGTIGGVGLADQSLILRQIAMLLKAGLPVDRSLDLLRDQLPRAAQRRWLSEVVSRVRGGEGLASAFACRPIFPDHVLGVIAAAERGGDLERAFVVLGDRMGELAQIRRDLVTALTYPAAVLAATLLALTMIVAVVIPQFEPLFLGEEERLPTLTLWVLGLSNMIRSYGLLLVLVFALTGGSLLLWANSAASSRVTPIWRRHLPLLALRDQFFAARFATLLGTLLGNGVTLIQALPLVAPSLASRRWRRWCRTVEQRLREGASISKAFGEDAMLPTAAVRLAEVGERGGRLGEALSEAGAIMQSAAKARVDRMVSLANPISIMLLGGFVATLIGGVMLGIFALGDVAT